MFTLHSTLDDAQRYYFDVRRRAASCGRDPNALKVFLAATFVLGEVAEAENLSTPHGLDEFVDKVVPLLQERGVFRTEYSGTTLRDHLGLAPVSRP
ncbi:hypothetical protein MNVI_21800 [Mycobacterium noviomagense]|uniref:Monooxygenase n=1 Tax=Mycobacterium noviomagense TaxID=459858 RepID=A0A7I7PE74_9MYCO|nr:hypothetical protein BST37_21430 [Mycobacterium noviomagense]BBY06862.1 hypothetical protein MNVI_21800 [Mycobacterium noviomagense]